MYILRTWNKYRNVKVLYITKLESLILHKDYMIWVEYKYIFKNNYYEKDILLIKIVNVKIPV